MIKKILMLLIVMGSSFVFAQQMTLEEFKEQAKTDIRFRPKYGEVQKTKEQLKSDSILMNNPNFKALSKKEISDKFVNLGLEYLNKGDIKIAMFRFNQSYLFNNKNPDTFRGFGLIYMVLGDLDNSYIQFEEGLKLDPKNARIQSNMSDLFMNKFYQSMDNLNEAAKYLETSLILAKEAYTNDKEEAKYSSKLSALYWINEDCQKAWEFYNISKNIDPKAITEDFSKQLRETCVK